MMVFWIMAERVVVMHKKISFISYTSMEINVADINTVKPKQDEVIFAEVVEAYQEMVYNIALGILQQAEDAEDVLQDVFVKMYESWDSFTGASVRSTWIYRIAVNMSMDALRRKKAAKRGGLLKRVFRLKQNEEPATFHHPGVTLDKKEEAGILFEALSKIPEKQMVAFLLQQLEGLPVKEIGVIMNTTDAAAESLLKRAKENLRKELQFQK